MALALVVKVSPAKTLIWKSNEAKEEPKSATRRKTRSGRGGEDGSIGRAWEDGMVVVEDGRMVVVVKIGTAMLDRWSWGPYSDTKTLSTPTFLHTVKDWWW